MGSMSHGPITSRIYRNGHARTALGHAPADLQTSNAHPGELQQVTYLVRNTSDRGGSPVRRYPSVTPGQGRPVFRQDRVFSASRSKRWGPVRRSEMPLAFIVKIGVPRTDRDIPHITLSYAFFGIDGQRQTLTTDREARSKNQHRPRQLSREHYFVPPAQPLSGDPFRRHVPSGTWLHPGNELLSARKMGHARRLHGHTLCPLRLVRGVIREAQGGIYRTGRTAPFRLGMIWFIVTEVMFFAAFSAPFFTPGCCRCRGWAACSMDMAPPCGRRFSRHLADQRRRGGHFKTMGAWGVPAINTPDPADVRRNRDLGALGAFGQ